MSKITCFALILAVAVLMLGSAIANSFAAVTIGLSQLSDYDKDNHYTTAIKPGTSDVSILRLRVTPDASENVRWTALQLKYTGTRLTDIGNNARLYQGSRLVSDRPFSAGVVELTFSESLSAGGNFVDYDVKVDVLPTAGSYKVDLMYLSSTFEKMDGSPYPAPTPTVTDPGPTGDPARYAGYAQVDASKPKLDIYLAKDAPVDTLGTANQNYYGIYDKGTKILKVRFYDELNPLPSGPKVVNPLVRLVYSSAVDAATQVKVNLPGIVLRTPDDSPSVNLGGGTLLHPSTASSLVYFQGNDAIKTDGSYGANGANAFSNEVWVRLTSAQDATVQNSILPEGGSDAGIPNSKVIEVYIAANTLWDAGISMSSPANAKDLAKDFTNKIDEHASDTYRVLVLPDTTKPLLRPDAERPVRFDYDTNQLTLSFNEAINATSDMHSTIRSRLKLTNAVIEADPNDTKVPMVIGDAPPTATISPADYVTTITITLNNIQKEILLVDTPQIIIADGAVQDVASQPIVGVTKNIYVTPPLLNATLSDYDGDPPTSVLNLKFSNEISAGSINFAKITVTNEDGVGPFKLLSDELVGIVADSQVLGTIVKFNLTRAHRDAISRWQQDTNITELRIIFEEGAVVDAEGKLNKVMSESKKIVWDKDDVRPNLVPSNTTYVHSSKELILAFDETLDLTSDATIANIVESPLIRLIGKKADGITSVGTAITLLDSEIKSGQGDGIYLKYILSDAHRDEISRWGAPGSDAVYINIEVTGVAVKDLTRVNGGASGPINISGTWFKDTSRPSFQAAYYSAALRRLRIRFSEPISNATGLKPVLGNITVHTPGAVGVTLAADATYEVDGDALIAYNLNNDQHNAIAGKTNPLVSLTENAVRDLAGLGSFAKTNGVIQYDETGPGLEVTGNSYTTNLDADNNNRPKSGTLILTFGEDVDVSTTDLKKISLQAGGISVSMESQEYHPDGLLNVITRTTEQDGKTLVIEISGADMNHKADKVYAICGLSEYLGLFVKLAKGAIKDLAGNENAEITKDLTFVKDNQAPVFNNGGSSYVHDDGSDNHYAALALKFTEQMDIRSAYITAANIELANAATGGDAFTLTDVEVRSGQSFGPTIYFNLSNDHRDAISRWGAPTSMGDTSKGATTLYARLSGNAVKDRTGNGNAVMNTRVALGAWTKDTGAPGYVSSAYNANNKQLTITFNEWMDVKPTTLVNPANLTIKNVDGGGGVNLSGAGVSETDNTKTITVTLTPAQDMDVKPLAKPLKLDMAAGAAKDIAGTNNAAAYQAITFTADTTAPGWAMQDSYLGSQYWHGDKRLELAFNEAIDRDPYTDIDATKIKLLSAASGGESFELTQAEIERKQPGDIVLPDPPGGVNKIRFILSSEHWNMVAKWSAIYVQITAGAVKDTTTANVIGNISPTQIHPNNVRLDTAPPDVRIYQSYSAAVGTDVPITAKVTDDISVKSVKLYYQVGGEVPTYMSMTPDGSTYKQTIPGSAVTNKGLSYYVLADDHAGNTNRVGNRIKTRKGDAEDWWNTDIPGGFNITVTGASVTLPAGTLPGFDPTAVPSQYRMISVPIDASKGSTTLFAPFGTAGIDWNAWKFTGVAPSYYQSGHSDGGFTLSKGEAAWIGTINPDADLTVAGTPLKIAAEDNAYKATITLRQGWNQIACPFNFSRNWDLRTIGGVQTGGNVDNRIYWFTGDTSSYSFASTDSTVPNQDAAKPSWKTAADFKGPATGRGWPGTLDPWGGYWVYAFTEGAQLTIDPTAPGKLAPVVPTAPSVQMPYNWSVKVMPEAGGVSGTTKFAGIVADADDGIDKYDVMDLPELPGQIARLSFITEAGDYLQDMKAPADEMFWNFKVNSAVNTPVTLRFDASAVPSEYRTVMLIDTVTDATTDLRKVASYAYKPSDALRNFKLIVSKAHPETYIVPKQSVLLQNYPNPFNPETWVPYRLSTAGDVTINIYNVAGQLVRTLEMGYREAGSYTVKERAAYWDGRNATGERVASGVYFYNIQSGSFHATKRMVIVK